MSEKLEKSTVWFHDETGTGVFSFLGDEIDSHSRQAFRKKVIETVDNIERFAIVLNGYEEVSDETMALIGGLALRFGKPVTVHTSSDSVAQKFEPFSVEVENRPFLIKLAS